MCDPVTLTVASTAVAMVGQGVSAYGEHQNARYQASIARMNAGLEMDRARDSMERGRIEERRFEQQASREKGRQRAALAANGIDPNFGSAADTRGDTAMFLAEDAQTIRENAMRETHAFEMNAYNERNRARSLKAQGNAALVGGAFGMASTALGGAAQYRKFSKKWGG